MPPRNLPIGSTWRIKVDGIRTTEQRNLYSLDYRSAVRIAPADRVPFASQFDELAISAPDGKTLIHVEMMDSRTYFVQLGEEKRMVQVKRDGSVVVGEAYE